IDAPPALSQMLYTTNTPVDEPAMKGDGRGTAAARGGKRRAPVEFSGRAQICGNLLVYWQKICPPPSQPVNGMAHSDGRTMRIHVAFILGSLCRRRDPGDHAFGGTIG